MSSGNFLPEYKPVKTSGKLQCLRRDLDVKANPEELVRQRVLNWLMNEKKWDKTKIELERSYTWYSDATRTRIRPDIELLDEDDSTLVVVECKHSDVPLSEKVDEQAKEYALKSQAPYIWVTNGDQNKFLRKSDKGDWEDIDFLKPLDVLSSPPRVDINFPDPTKESDVRRYFREFPDPQFKRFEKKQFVYLRDITLAFHKIFFDMGSDMKTKLPYSHGGVHVLEYRGRAYHAFDNRSGGGYHTLYGDFIAATQGRVEALSTGINTWDSDDNENGIRLCVGASRTSRKHHALQANCAEFEWNQDEGVWRVYHGGSMSSIKSEVVLEAVAESGAGNWIVGNENGKDRIYLGDLHPAESATWRNSKKLLANLLHYGIIRTNLREANAASAKKAKKK